MSRELGRLQREWRIILKYILKTQYVDLWTTFMWRSVVRSGPVFRQWRFNPLIVSVAATHFTIWVSLHVLLFFFARKKILFFFSCVWLGRWYIASGITQFLELAFREV